jgi:hypothetical protein
LKFDRAAGGYREDDGAIVPRAKVLAELEKASMGLERRLEESMSKLVVSELARAANPQKWERSRNKYTIADFQKEAKQFIKDVTMQMALLGAGGRESADARIYGTAGAQLKKNYQALSRLGEQLAAGELTTAQAIDRARRASGGTRQAFHRAEQIQRARDGFTEGWRRLSPGFRHCPSCPGYESGGWVPIADIVPVGMGCECGGRCKCQISFRKVVPAELSPTPIGSGTSETIATRTTRVGSRGTRVTSRISLSGGRLADQIMRKQEEL